MRTYRATWMLLFLTALAGCGEPAPSTHTDFEPGEIGVIYGESISFVFSGQGDSTLDLSKIASEVFAAEFEDSRWSVVGSGGDIRIAIELESYRFVARDGNGPVPGWLVPGVVPFGPLGWWIYKRDDRIRTPTLDLSLTVTSASGKSRGATQVVRAVSTEEDLARVAFSEMARRTRHWLGGDR